MTMDRPPRRPPGPPPLEQYRPQLDRPQGARRVQPMPAGRRRPAPPKSNWVRNLVLAGVGLVAVAGAAALFLSVAFPGDVVRDRLVAEVKARTGRDLTINGPVTFSAVPSARVSLQDISLSAPAGVDAPPLVSAPSLDVSVSLWPLLWRDVVVDSVVLKDPVFSFAVDGSGRDNWTIQRTAGSISPVRLAQSDAQVTTDAGPVQISTSGSGRANVSLNELRVENGTVRFKDARKGDEREATNLSATFAVRSLTSPATGNGAFVYRGETVEFALEVGAVEPLLSKSSSRLSVDLKSQPFIAGYEGSIFPANGEAEGTLELRATSLSRTAVWLGASLPERVALGNMALKGQLRSAGKTHALTNIELNVNGTAATGHLTIDATPARPKLRGELNVADLNLNTLTAPPVTPPAEPDRASGDGRVDGAEPSRPTPEAAGEPASQPDATRVNGYAARGGWNEDPIRLAALSAVDAELKLGIGSLVYRDIKAGAARVSVDLNDSSLKATFEDVQLYGGHGRGFVVLDGRTADAAHVELNLALDNVTLRPLLQDAAKIDWIEGQGNATIAVAGVGPHQRGVIESLAGKADLKVTKGAVIGIDIDRMAENLADGKFKGLKGQPGDKTPFSSLTATWKIENGIAHNDDLRLTSELVQVAGAGAVMLPDSALDYTIRPRLTGEGENDGKGLSGIEVPVRVSGSWEKPSYKADVGGAVEELGKRLKGKDAGEIIDEFVGKDSKGESKAKKLLDKLFR